jgi:hypothetical protein
MLTFNSVFFSSPDPKGNQKKELILVAMFVGQMELNEEAL